VRRTDRRRCLFIGKQGRDNTIVKKERGRDKIKSTGNRKVRKKVNGKIVVSQWLRADSFQKHG
jgi:hypothetical protein